MRITKKIISNLINRDDKTLEAFYLEYANQLAAYIDKIVKDKEAAIDLTMDLLEDIPKIVEKHYNSIEDERGFVRWLYIVARNRAVNYYKKYSIREERVEEVVDYVGCSFVDDMFEFKIENLENVLDKELFIIIYLKYKRNLKINEIAEILNLTENQVKKRTHKAYEIIKQFIEEVYGV